MFEVAIFLVEASATASVEGRVQAGDRYSLLVFQRQQKGVDPDISSAIQKLSKLGWTNIVVSKGASGYSVEILNTLPAELQSSYEDALNNGFAASVFSVPI